MTKADEARAKRLTWDVVGATTRRGREVEAARVDRQWPTTIWLTFAGTGPAPFREAMYSMKEVEALLRGEW